jgi:endonuclease III
VLTKAKWLEFLDVMDKMFPNAHCELVHENPFELTIATLLSAQCTDALVNRVTKDLFQKYKTPQDYLNVELEELQKDIRSIGLYRNKAKNIQLLCQRLIDEYNGEIPANREALVTLPGVGRKTANVVLSVAFNVERITKRLGLCRWKDSVLEVEETIMKKTPIERWSRAHHQMIFFGRYHCKAQNPQCHECPLLSDCREGQKRLKKGLVKS